MQPHQYVLGAGILWLATLAILPFLIATARRRAYALGFKAGKAFHDQILNLQLKEARQGQEELRKELQRNQQACTQQLDARQASISALKSSVSELEARLMSYTGLAVTKEDYEKLVSVASTLRLAQRTLKALKSKPQAERAATQADAIGELAKRVHAQLRTPTSAASMGSAK